MQRIGLLGGSFNPIHLGHLHLAESARYELQLDKILFIPTGVNPFKGETTGITSKHRLDMIRLAIAGNPGFELSEIEITRTGKSYTIDTIEILQRTYPDAIFFFITGADIMFEITRWKGAEDLFECLTFVTACRPGVSRKKLDARIKELEEVHHANIIRLIVPEMEIASSTIRGCIKKGQPVRYMLPEVVEKYIVEHQLYGETTPYSALTTAGICEKLQSTLKPSRYLHTMGVVDAAVDLAKRYDCDVEKTRIAALLHDCAKNFSDEMLLETANRAKLEVDEITQLEPQLFHGPVGGVIAHRAYGVDDSDILNAITYHTTGRVGMSTLEKIIYLADFIEPGRSYPGVEELREISKEGLDAAVIKALSNTIRYISSLGGLIHPRTVEARNALLLEEIYGRKEKTNGTESPCGSN